MSALSPALKQRLLGLLTPSDDEALAAQGCELLCSLGTPVVAALLAAGSLSGCDLRAMRWDGIDLSGADLRGSLLARLPGADLRGCRLQRADLRGADLRGADLRGANLERAWLDGADLRAADLRQAVLKDAKLVDVALSEADLRQCCLRGAWLRGMSLAGVPVAGADLRGAWLEEDPAGLIGILCSEETRWGAEADRSSATRWPPEPGADLSGVFLFRDSLVGAGLAGIRLDSAILDGCTLRGADLRQASLRGAVLRDTSLRDADLRGADLSGASLTRCSLRGTDLRRASLRGTALCSVRMVGAQVAAADFTDARAEAVRIDASLAGGLSESLGDGVVIEAPPPPPPVRQSPDLSPRDYLVSALRDRDWKVREAAARSLGELGEGRLALEVLLAPEAAAVSWGRLHHIALQCRPSWIQAHPMPDGVKSKMLEYARLGWAADPQDRVALLLKARHNAITMFESLPLPERRLVHAARADSQRSWWKHRRQRPTPRKDHAHLLELLSTKDSRRLQWLTSQLSRPWMLPHLVPVLGEYPDRLLPVLGKIRAPGDLSWLQVLPQLPPHLRGTGRRARFAAETAGRCGEAAVGLLPLLLALTLLQTPIRAAATRAIGRILAGPAADTTPGHRLSAGSSAGRR